MFMVLITPSDLWEEEEKEYLMNLIVIIIIIIIIQIYLNLLVLSSLDCSLLIIQGVCTVKWTWLILTTSKSLQLHCKRCKISKRRPAIHRSTKEHDKHPSNIRRFEKFCEKRCYLGVFLHFAGNTTIALLSFCIIQLRLSQG